MYNTCSKKNTIKQDTLKRSPISLFPRYIIPFLYIFISFWLSCHCFFFNYMQISKPPPSLTEGSNIYKFEPCLFSLTVH